MRATPSGRFRPRLMSIVSMHEDQDSFSEVARLLSDFFCELDVVPSDVVAGLILLRKVQQARKRRILCEADNETYQFLSGAAITKKTKFVDLNSQNCLEELVEIRHYMSYALAAYGWPFYLRYHDGVCCTLMANSNRHHDAVEDNCLGWNMSALKLTLPSHNENIHIVYASFHCAVGETPFFVAVDRERGEVVISIRGTLSLRDLFTDLNANIEEINVPLASSSSSPSSSPSSDAGVVVDKEPSHPIDNAIDKSSSPVVEVDYMGHAGIVRAGNYVLLKLKQERLIEKAMEQIGGNGRIVILGHSLGAGAAVILGLRLRPQYPNLICFAYSPPGGLLSWEAAEETRSWVKTIVVGKDMVPRLGMAQMRELRRHIMHLISNCKETKWKVIGQSFPCCQSTIDDDNDEPLLTLNPTAPTGHQSRNTGTSGGGSGVIVGGGEPKPEVKLHLPGRILHVVRTWTKETRKTGSPEYVGLWAEPEHGAFNTLLVSPVMIHDHMPDGVIEALDKIVERCEKYVLHKKENSLSFKQGLSPISTMNSIPTIQQHSTVIKQHQQQQQQHQVKLEPCYLERLKSHSTPIIATDSATSASLDKTKLKDLKPLFRISPKTEQQLNNANYNNSNTDNDTTIATEDTTLKEGSPSIPSNNDPIESIDGADIIVLPSSFTSTNSSNSPISPPSPLPPTKTTTTMISPQQELQQRQELFTKPAPQQKIGSNIPQVRIISETSDHNVSIQITDPALFATHPTNGFSAATNGNPTAAAAETVILAGHSMVAPAPKV